MKAKLLCLAALAACGTRPAEDPSYLLVVLDAVHGNGGTPENAHVRIGSGTKELAALCIRLKEPGETPASLVLRRDYGKDATTRVTVEVTPYGPLAGDEGAEAGKEFSCPPMLPTPLAAAQVVSVAFCEAKAEKLVFHVGATCCSEVDAGGAPDAGADGGVEDAGADAGVEDAGADAGVEDGGTDAGADAGAPPGPACGCSTESVCGAGLSPEGHACFRDECCSRTVSDACALEPAPAGAAPTSG